MLFNSSLWLCRCTLTCILFETLRLKVLTIEFSVQSLFLGIISRTSETAPIKCNRSSCNKVGISPWNNLLIHNLIMGTSKLAKWHACIAKTMISLHTHTAFQSLCWAHILLGSQESKFSSLMLTWKTGIRRHSRACRLDLSLLSISKFCCAQA